MLHYYGNNDNVLLHTPLSAEGKKPKRVKPLSEQPTKLTIDLGNLNRKHKPRDTTGEPIVEVDPFLQFDFDAKIYKGDLAHIMEKCIEAKEKDLNNLPDITLAVVVNPQGGDWYAFHTRNMTEGKQVKHYLKEDTYIWKMKWESLTYFIKDTNIVYQKAIGIARHAGRFPGTFKKYYIIDLANEIVLLYYTGYNQLADRFMPHGNDRSTDPNAFTRKNKVVDDLIAKEDSTGGPVPASVLESRLRGMSSGGLAGKVSMEPTAKHIGYFRKLGQKFNKLPPFNSVVDELITIGNMNADFVQEQLLQNTIRVYCATHAAVGEVVRILTHKKHRKESLLFHLDTTYKFTNLYLTTLSIRHPLMEVRKPKKNAVDTRPIMPVAFFLHENRELIHHQEFLRWVQETIDKQCKDSKNFSNARKILTTDREFKDIPWNNTHHNYCWRHITNNIEKNVEKDKHELSAREKTQVLADIFSLRGSKSRDEYDEKLQRFRNQPDGVWTKRNWNTYYNRFIDQQIAEHSGRWLLEEWGYFRASHGLTNNASETLNSMMRHHTESKRNSPGDFILFLKEFAMLNDMEIDTAYYQDGKYKLRDAYKHLESDLADKPAYNIPTRKQFLTEIWKIFHEGKKMPDLVLSGPEDDSDEELSDEEFNHPISKEAQYIFIHQGIEAIANKPGTYLVTDRDGNTAYVFKDSHGVHCQKCNIKMMCPHKLAVLRFRNDRPNFTLRLREIPKNPRYARGAVRPGSMRGQTEAQTKPRAGLGKKRPPSKIPPRQPTKKAKKVKPDSGRII